MKASDVEAVEIQAADVKASNDKRTADMEADVVEAAGGNEEASPTKTFLKKRGKDLTQRLLEAGDDEARKQKLKNQALQFASARGEIEKIKSSLEAGAEVNSRNNQGYTPLVKAVKFGSFEATQVLIDAGAEVNSKNDFGDNPLSLATTPDIAKLLLRSGADLECKDPDGNSPLLLAVKKDRKDLTEIFIEAGAVVKTMGMDGFTPLLTAVATCRSDIAELLIKAGTDVKIDSRNGNTLLGLAAGNGDVKTTALLLDAGAMEGGGGKEAGAKALLTGIRCGGSVAVVRLLLQRGADPAVLTSRIDSPFARMTFAAVDVVRYLALNHIKLSPEPFLFRDYPNDGVSAMEEGVPLVLRRNPEVLELLRSRARNPRPLFHCCLDAVRTHFRHSRLPFHNIRDLPLPGPMLSKLLYDN